MARLCLFLCLLLAGVAGAQRVDEYDAAAIPPSSRVAVLGELADGGCMLVEVCARLQSKDAGSQIQSCDQVRRELGGQNQTTCLNVLQKAGTLWANRQSASSADSGL